MDHSKLNMNACQDDMKAALTRRGFLRNAAMAGFATTVASGFPGGVSAQEGSTLVWAKLAT